MKLIQLGDGWVMWSATILAILFNAKVIYEFFEKLEKRKISTLSEGVGEKGATGKTREVLQEQLNSYLFKYGTGIYAEKILREEIIKLHEFASGSLTFLHFKRARSMLKIANGSLVIEIKNSDILSHYFNYAIAIFFTTVFIAIFLLSTVAIDMVSAKLGLLAFSFFCIALAMLAFSQTFPYFSAKILHQKNEEMKAHNEATQPESS
jgi:hypothetical protein